MQHFWNKVDIKDQADCWNWLGGRFNTGYGRSSIRPRQPRRIGELAHRIAYELTNGKILDGLHVLHKCDNKLCCNPNHLFLGTHADNMQDMVNKDRHKGFAGQQHSIKTKELISASVKQSRK